MADAPRPNTPPPAGAADAASAAATSVTTAQPKSALDRFLAWCLRHWLLTGITLLIGSCAFMTRDRTVTWDEEVPLNTGETIWVTRDIRYVMQGAGGNPMDLAMRPKWKETLSFEWKGQKYSYTGEAAIMLVAISPITSKPVLVANAMIKGWYRENKYQCVKPFYVQFNPDVTGRTWTWPPAIEPWLHNLPYNIMHHKPTISKALGRYTAEDRAELDRGLMAVQQYLLKIEPVYSSEFCQQRKG